MQENIILVGLMGAGKSTIGKQLARRLKLEFFDSDRYLEEKTGVSIATIFSIEGENGFRDREEEVIAELTAKQGIVLATGGGSILRDINRQRLMNNGVVIYLKASPEQLYERIKHDTARPLMQTDNPLQTLRHLLKVRDPFYCEVADLIITSGRQRLSWVLRDIQTKLPLIATHKGHTHANFAG
ncbi:shikimate kinase AroK [Thiofilum flexile]|uniref:shikimate kinase AroK n=1 Tax=Thiofilum flexile TaxID=125627 RepID=UPI000380B474|nr:shikimate kinase AroK [Thiofilum flexile]